VRGQFEGPIVELRQHVNSTGGRTPVDPDKNAGARASRRSQIFWFHVMADSLQCARRHGTVCMSGMVGDQWWFDEFSPMDVIPTAVNLTIYSGGADDFMRTPLQSLVRQVETGARSHRTCLSIRSDSRSPSLHGRKLRRRQNCRAYPLTARNQLSLARRNTSRLVLTP
jgi:hypothetical protein